MPKDETTLTQALRPQREVVLPSGLKAGIRQVLLADYEEMLGLFSVFLETLAGKLGRPAEQQDVAERLPGVLLELHGFASRRDLRTVAEAQGQDPDAFAEGAKDGRAQVARFLGFFCDATLDELGWSDFEALWREVYRDNRVPFELRAQDPVVRALMMMAAGLVNFSEPSTEPESTQESPA